MQLLTKKDLAQRWQVSERTIDNWVAEGIVPRCKNIPSVRFAEETIRQLEGLKLERFSPIERRRLEREIEQLKRQNAELRRVVASVMSLTASAHELLKEA